MKKLMIAAAAAAMIGAAEAYTPEGAAYDFSASLKTTKAKEGKGSTIKYEYKLGHDGDGEYWYESSSITRVGNVAYWEDSNGDTYKIATFNSKNIAKIDLSDLTVDQGLELASDLRDYCRVYVDGTWVAGDGEPDIYKKKETWCATYKTTYKIDGQCYRVAGSEKITATYVAWDCCNGDGEGDAYLWRLESKLVKNNDQLLPDLTTDLLYLFGAEQQEKCKKVEFVGQIGNGVALNGTFTDEVIPTFALAAQGDYAELKDAAGDKWWGVKSLSGNIVGIWYDPECEVCCGNNGIAACWSVCCGCTHDGETTCGNVYEYDVDAAYDTRFVGTKGLEYLWGTAAYGTFTLKFNSKNSDF